MNNTRRAALLAVAGFCLLTPPAAEAERSVECADILTTYADLFGEFGRVTSLLGEGLAQGALVAEQSGRFEEAQSLLSLSRRASAESAPRMREAAAALRADTPILCSGD